MARGRKYQPIKLLQLKGSQYAKDAIEPEAELGIPTVPAWLSDQAKEIFIKTAKLIDGMKILAKVDGFALARYANSFALWQETADYLNKNGNTYQTATGETKSRPEAHFYNNLCSILSKLESEFCMTPSARARMRIDATQRTDEKDEYFK